MGETRHCLIFWSISLAGMMDNLLLTLDILHVTGFSAYLDTRMKHK